MSAVSAAAIGSDIEAAINSSTGNGQFIIELNKNACINDFVPKFIDHAYEITAQTANKDLAKKSNKVVRRDTEEEHVHVFDAYNIGDDYKAIGVKFKDSSIIRDLVKKLGNEIVTIIPDQDLQFDLPTLKTPAAKEGHSRRAPSERKGNLHIESLGKGCAKGDNNVYMKRAEIAPEPVFSAQSTISQPNADWGLVRITQRGPVGSATTYRYSTTAGSSVIAYVIDDGLRADHQEFEGRATFGGKTYGVAKKIKLVGVKALDSGGIGQISAILSSLQFVSTNAGSHLGKAIVNMSFGIEKTRIPSSGLASLNSAINSLVASGVPVFTAVGNANKDACNFMPAGNTRTYSVGATTKDDKMAGFSNYGRCTRILAPGENIKSAISTSTTATAVMSGTSMAAPHVAGVAALFIDLLGKPKPIAVYNTLDAAVTKNAIHNVKSGTPNAFLFINPV
ncbi:Extracellular serine proteinase [Choanephora cucurbitarum]|uniref:Extracellular serine proteinase n=1 Tax=Choanephora cucurbitarum TaxID=101091 RepID=A0A1C7NFY9_9FUNG|nr:Extracellular serine proteinase [Choanephora cucurbitarum]